MEGERRLQEPKRTRGPRGRGGTGFQRPVLASSATKDSDGPSQQVRTSQPRHPSLQGSIYQVSIFLPVYW